MIFARKSAPSICELPELLGIPMFPLHPAKQLGQDQARAWSVRVLGPVVAEGVADRRTGRALAKSASQKTQMPVAVRVTCPHSEQTANVLPMMLSPWMCDGEKGEKGKNARKQESGEAGKRGREKVTEVEAI